jgi:hypothetical protein
MSLALLPRMLAVVEQVNRGISRYKVLVSYGVRGLRRVANAKAELSQTRSCSCLREPVHGFN